MLLISLLTLGALAYRDRWCVVKLRVVALKVKRRVVILKVRVAHSKEEKKEAVAAAAANSTQASVFRRGSRD